MIFVDTSALVKPYLREFGADTMTQLLFDEREDVFISRHVALEVVATFAYKFRDRQLSRREYLALRRRFINDIPEVFQVLGVDEAVVDRAIQLADTHRAFGVGSVDLIHVATAEQLAAEKGRVPTIVCADRAMRNLAAAAGFGVFNPETDDPATLALGG
jgi:predicted nucleic acid-binding protein